MGARQSGDEVRVRERRQRFTARDANADRYRCARSASNRNRSAHRHHCRRIPRDQLASTAEAEVVSTMVAQAGCDFNAAFWNVEGTMISRDQRKGRRARADDRRPESTKMHRGDVPVLVIARASYFAEVPLWTGTVLDGRRRDAKHESRKAP